MHRFNPDHHAKLDDPERLEWQNPELLIQYLSPKPDDVIVDIGSGTGYFAIPLAEARPEAQIIGADISPRMAGILADKAAEKNLKNITAIILDESDLPFANGFADIVLMANVLHEFADPRSIIAEARRVLRSGGRLVIVDWKREPTPVGPPIDERISEDDVRSLVISCGFKPNAAPVAYPYNYVLECV